MVSEGVVSCAPRGPIGHGSGKTLPYRIRTNPSGRGERTRHAQQRLPPVRTNAPKPCRVRTNPTPAGFLLVSAHAASSGPGAGEIAPGPCLVLW
jgi:hypothetical protein